MLKVVKILFFFYIEIVLKIFFSEKVLRFFFGEKKVLGKLKYDSLKKYNIL